jgi:hypothetical protein
MALNAPTIAPARSMVHLPLCLHTHPTTGLPMIHVDDSLTVSAFSEITYVDLVDRMSLIGVNTTVNNDVLNRLAQLTCELLAAAGSALDAEYEGNEPSLTALTTAVNNFSKSIRYRRLSSDPHTH